MPPTYRLLHFAPEESIAQCLRKHFPGKYVTADLYAPNVDLQFDISAIPLPDDSVNVIYCSHVLEHVADDYTAMRELRRILHPNGTAIVMVPITVQKTFEDSSVVTPEDRLRVFGQRDHVRRYGSDVKDRLIESGFKVNTVTASDFLTREDIMRFGLGEPTGDVIHVCTLV